MTEAEARAALVAVDAGSEIERWIAARPWKAAMGGWTVVGELQRLRFRVEAAPGGVRVIALGGRVSPAVWTVPGARGCW